MPEDVVFGPFQLIESERLLLREGQPVGIGSRALDILVVLVRKAGEVVTRRELMEQVWADVTVEESSLRVHVAALRKALGDGQDGARYVTNVQGRGYCFVAPIQRTGRTAPEARSVPAQTAPCANLPPRLSRMVGREETVAEVSALLQAKRFVSIVGPGGMGKTTVAVAVAHALAENFHHAVHFVDLGTVHDEALVGTATSLAVGCPVQARNPLEALVSFIGDKPMLLVLDNCEHLINAAAQAAEWLTKAAPHIYMLTTSREVLRVEGENVYLLSPLSGPRDTDVLTAADALRLPAVQLFMERAGASGHRVPLSDEDARTVAQICKRLDGIALAIELAAARVGAHGIPGTATMLDDRFRLLWQGRRTAIPRHQTLHALLDWSFYLLSQPEQATLCRLSVFAGNFTLDAGLAVAAGTDAEVPNVVTAVEGLVSKSLVWVSHRDGATLYRLLDTTRAYAAGKLAERGEVQTIARRHAAYCIRFIPPSPQNPPALASPNIPHIDDVRAALTWAFSEDGDGDIGIDLAVKSAPLLFHLSLLEECRRWAERAISALRDTDRNSERELVLLEASAMSSMFTRGNSADVRVAIERALALAGALGNRRRELHLLVGMNVFATRAGEFRSALALAQRGVEVAAEAGDPAGNALAEWTIGASQHLFGDQAAAQRHCERGFEIFAESGGGDMRFFGYDHRVRALAALARILWLRGRPDEAVAVAHKAVENATVREHPIDVCLAYIYTLPVHLWVGDITCAEDLIERLHICATRHSFTPYRVIGDAMKGELAIRRGDAMTGVQLLRGALAALNADRHRTLVATFSRTLAEALAGVGQFEDALATIRSATLSALERGGTFELPDLLRAEGEILSALPQPDTAGAEEAFLRSIACAQQQSALGWEMRAATVLARLLAAQGRSRKAYMILNDVFVQYQEGFGTADLIAAKSLLAELKSV
jgi:predicted ATPase/DNA-binding winged helix-turn-helix (wHTH) protein